MNMAPQVTPVGLLPAKKVSPWRAILSAVCYFIFYFAIRLVVEIGYTIYLYATLPLQGLSEEAATELLMQASYDHGNYLMIIIDVLIFLVLAIVFLARGKTFAEGMGMKKTKISNVLLAFAAGLGLTCLLGFVMIFVAGLFPGLMEDYNNTMDASYNMQSLVPYILAGVVGAPLVEELIFRHLVTGRLDRGIPRVVAILIGSVLFGVIHGHPVQWVYAGVLGFVMACVYFAYDSIWVPIAMHAGFNSLSVLAYVEAIEMSEAQEMLFGSLMFLGEVAFVLFGTVALIFLLIRRPHKIFEKDPHPLQSVPLTAPAAPVRLFYHTTPTVTANIPTVANFSQNRPATTAPDVPADPIAPVEPNASVEAEAPVEPSNTDEAGGNL